MFTQTKTRKLHSVHSLLIESQFSGEIEVGSAKLKFSYSPTAASLANDRIELTGSFSVKSAREVKKTEAVKATLLSTQGGIQTAPPTPDGASASMLGPVHSGVLPPTDATGSRGYVAVIYFKLSALDGAKLGVPYDLSALQLNARLNPLNETDRALQFWISVAVNAVHGQSPNKDLALQSLRELNTLLKA